MKLTVRFSDFNSKVYDLINTGYMPPVEHRIVQIELTEEQIKQLNKRKISETGYPPKDIFETREVLSLED